MKIIVSILFSLLIINLVFADVTEIKSVKVNFPKFGNYENITQEYYQGNIRLEESQGHLKGKGFLGKMAAHFFPKGKQATIFDLNQKMIYNLNYIDSTYTKHPIEKYFEESDEYYEDSEYQEENEEADNYKVIRVIFNVKKTGQKREINKFKTTRYKILYLYEKEEISTGKRIVDSLKVDVFTTSDISKFNLASGEKRLYNKKMMDLIGIDTSKKSYEDMLGLNWISMLSQMQNSKSDSEIKPDYAKLRKIKGEPILVEGSYFVREYTPGVKAKPKAKKKHKFGFGSLVDKMADTMDNTVNVDKSGSNIYKKVLSWGIETKKISLGDIPDRKLHIPEGFEQILQKN